MASQLILHGLGTEVSMVTGKRDTIKQTHIQESRDGGVCSVMKRSPPQPRNSMHLFSTGELSRPVYHMHLNKQSGLGDLHSGSLQGNSLMMQTHRKRKLQCTLNGQRVSTSELDEGKALNFPKFDQVFLCQPHGSEALATSTRPYILLPILKPTIDTHTGLHTYFVVLLKASSILHSFYFLGVKQPMS